MPISISPGNGEETATECIEGWNKKRVMKLTPDEFGIILATAIDKVNHGSLESIDKHVNEELLTR